MAAHFNVFKTKPNTSVVWVRLLGLSLEYYDELILHLVGNEMGRLLKVDAKMVTTEWRNCARLSVELELDKPLQLTIHIDDHLQKLQYEGLTLCYWYGCIGHAIHQCPGTPLHNTT
ncbi:hypothetical protein ACH5RR_018240 [Cinchona calisaya]|uniref:DUF4283 domain-containing protein n=1 Tax=Cinchona calisaya TaxID=153742 RepID=A0ABD2ZMJ8_9GENT